MKTERPEPVVYWSIGCSCIDDRRFGLALGTLWEMVEWAHEKVASPSVTKVKTDTVTYGSRMPSMSQRWVVGVRMLDES